MNIDIFNDNRTYYMLLCGYEIGYEIGYVYSPISQTFSLFAFGDRPILFVGPTGTGKSSYVQEKMMNGVSRDKYLPTFVNFSAQTSANQTQVLV